MNLILVNLILGESPPVPSLSPREKEKTSNSAFFRAREADFGRESPARHGAPGRGACYSVTIFGGARRASPRAPVICSQTRRAMSR